MTGIDSGADYYADAPDHERAAAHLAKATLGEEKLFPYTGVDNGRIDWEDLRWASRSWSDGERDLVWLCASFADETPLNMRANVGKLLGAKFSDETVQVIVEAVRIACTGRVS
jgi:hypothetical protein